MNLFFNTSMPRSGSELLQVILHQNPSVYASSTSPLLEYQFAARQNFSLPEVQSQPLELMETAFLSMCRSMAEGYYSAITDRPYIIDKNRALLYLTDKKEKKYLGLTADRIITRTWLLLDKQNKLNLIRNYPNDMFAKKNISKIFNEFKFSMIENNFESKYDLDLLFSKKNMSVYIFQDFTTFSKEGNKFRNVELFKTIFHIYMSIRTHHSLRC